MFSWTTRESVMPSRLPAGRFTASVAKLGVERQGDEREMYAVGEKSVVGRIATGKRGPQGWVQLAS